MHKSLTFNGIRKSWLYLLEGRVKSPFAPIRNNLIRVPGMPGAYVASKETDVLYITQPIGFIVKNDEHALKIKDELAEWLITAKAVPLQFDDEPGRTYYAEIEGTIEDFERFVDQRRGVITFLCADPYSYGEEKTKNFTSDTFIVENNGTAETYPIIELTATEKATFAMISNGEEYNLIGQPAEVDVEVVDERVLKLEERGETLNEWTSQGTSVDGGNVSGQFGTDGTGITVLNYGTGPRWHGPALIREINPIQDFEVEMQCRVETSRPNQTFRIEFYLFDEYMNNLGKMAVVDNSDKLIFFVAEGRYGPFIAHHVNYAISSRNYQIRERHFHGMLRMKRIGQRFEFYVARMTTGETPRHFDTLTQVFNDVNNEYQGKLRYVLIHIGKFSGTDSPNIPRINYLKVYEHNKVVEDQTPYIIYPGDIVEFDHVNKDIRINGESRKDLKAFGGSFFTLKKGINTLTVMPENTFNTKITYRERYK